MSDKNINIKVKSDTGDAESKLGKLGSLFQTIGNNAGSQIGIFKQLGGAIGTAFSAKKIVDFEKQAFKTRAGFEQSMYNVKALSGATGKEFDSLSKKAREMGAATVYSAKDSADAMGVMAQMGWNSGQIIGSIRPVLDLATASNTDLARSAEIVVTSMNAFNLSTDKAGRVSDVFAKIQAKTGSNLNELGEAMKYVAPVASQMGMSVETASKYIGILADNSIKGSMAGTTLRTTFARLANPVENVSKGLAKYTEITGIAIPEMASVEEKLQLLANGWGKLSQNQKIQLADQIAGKNAMAGFLTIMDGHNEKMSKMDKIMQDTTISAKALADEQQNNLYGAVKSVQSAWEELQIAFMTGQSQVLQDTIRGIAQFMRDLANEIEYVGQCMDLAYNEIIKPTLEWIVNKLGELGIHFDPIKKFLSETLGQSKEFQKVVGLIGLAFLGLGVILIPLVGTFTLLKGVMKGLGIVALIGKLKDLAIAFGGVVLAINPVLAGFALLGVALALLAIHWDEVTTFLKEKWQDFDTKFKGWLDDENEKLVAWQERTGESIKQNISHVGDMIKKWWEGKSAGQEFCESVARDFETAKQRISDAISSIKEFMRNMFDVQIKTPHIPTPKFEKSGSFSLNPPSVPSFRFAGWNAKGAIFNKPTVIGSYGVGDAVGGHGSNAEAVLPIDELPTLLGLDRIHNTLDAMENSSQVVNFVVDGRTLAKGTYKRFDQEGGQRVKLSERGIR